LKCFKNFGKDNKLERKYIQNIKHLLHPTPVASMAAEVGGILFWSASRGCGKIIINNYLCGQNVSSLWTQCYPL